MPRKLIALAFAFLLCGAAATAGLMTAAPAPAPIAPEAQAFDLELARAYVDAQCWQCHTVGALQQALTQHFGPLAAGARAAGPDLSGVGGLYSDGWHYAHLWQPDAVSAGSHMPAQRHLFVFDGRAQTDNSRGEKRPAIKISTQRAISFVQTLTTQSVRRTPWPRGLHVLPFPGSVREGQGLFAMHCSGCHGPAADGKSEAALFFAKPPANLAAGLMVWRSSKAPLPSYHDLFSTLTNGLPGSGMPSFAHLSAHERASLVAWIASLNREEFDAYEPEFGAQVAPKVPLLTEQMAARGRELFADKSFYKCADCHGAEGRGDGYMRAEVIRSFGFAPRDLVTERLRRGYPKGLFATIALGLGRPMSGYLKDDGSNEADVWALVAYVQSINRFER